jgi:hypothetical protein
MKLTESVGKRLSESAIWTNYMSEKSDLNMKFAVCVNNSDYPASLDLHKIYRVLPDEDAAADGDLRIIDESGEDYLYPANYFVLVSLPSELEASLMRAA